MNSHRVRISDLKTKKQRGEKIAMLTAYDATIARLLERAGVDVLLAGDSVGMAVLGYETTLPVTMDVMVHHTAAGHAAGGSRRIAGRRARASRGWRLRAGARRHPLGSRSDGDGGARHSDHRHRRRTRLRRAGSRQLRHARPLRRIRAAVRQALR